MYLDFLKAYRAWVDDGAPEDHLVFDRLHALCGNLERYVYDPYAWRGVLDSMRARMSVLYGDHNYPLSKGGTLISRLTYYEDEAPFFHLNPQRIAFVDAEIERLSAK